MISLFEYSILSAINYTDKVIILLLILIGIRGYRVRKIKGRKLLQLTNKVIYASHWTSDDKPYGLCIGKYFICYIYESKSSLDDYAMLFTDDKNYRLLMDSKLNDDKLNDGKLNDGKKIYLYERFGAFYRISWEKKPIEVCHSIRNKQMLAVDKIIDLYKRKRTAVCLIWGEPKSGKSYIPLFLAKQLLLLDHINDISITDDHNPTDPNDSFGSLYNTISPNNKAPLIVCIDEIDQYIDLIHKKLIINHKHLPISIKNKTDWNRWLDKIDRGYYPYTIIIFTSNKSIDYFNQLDNSYFREGRIDMVIEL